MGGELPASSTYSGAISYHYPQAGLMRRSLPNMAHSILVHEPAKIYPYHLLLITNYRLPSDVDRCNLEVSYRCLVYPSSNARLITFSVLLFLFTATFIRCWIRSYSPMYAIWILSFATMASQWPQTSSSLVLSKADDSYRGDTEFNDHANKRKSFSAK